MLGSLSRRSRITPLSGTAPSAEFGGELPRATRLWGGLGAHGDEPRKNWRFFINLQGLLGSRPLRQSISKCTPLKGH
jgi:hypothetical protein